jgi:TRAP-type C4-dicarboxylate transport system permease small subunit
MYALLHRSADVVARGLALLGGAVLVGLVVMTCLSILGRALVPFGLAPITGDFELIEIGVAFSVFAFLPWCQMQRGHAAVDLLKPMFSASLNKLLDLVIDLAMLAAAWILAWRLWLGMLDKRNFGETTFILQFPVWQAYAACMIGASGFVLVAAFCCVRSAHVLLGYSDEQISHVEH